jgi:hypothetical protein
MKGRERGIIGKKEAGKGERNNREGN